MARTLYIAVVSGGKYDDAWSVNKCASFDLQKIEKFLADEEARDIVKDSIEYKINDFYIQWHKDNRVYEKYEKAPPKPKTKATRGGNGRVQLTPEENKIHCERVEAWKHECEKINVINTAISEKAYDDWIAALKKFYDENGWEHPTDGNYTSGSSYIDEKSYTYETVEYLED